MVFRSTRGGGGEVSFKTAVFEGLAPDGGLFHPTSKPDLKKLFLSFTENTGYNQLAEAVTSRLLGPEISQETTKRIVEGAYTFSPQLQRLDDSLYLLELFHGPSYAFKDFGACYLASCMEQFLSRESRQAIVLVATSGDTGSAVARAFYGKKNIQVVILYPSGRVSLLQEKQLTTMGENIRTLEVKGSFDDCQIMVKQAFTDSELNRKLMLTSANSINLGRLIPQSYYYVYAYAQLANELDDGLVFCVPSGNFGNLTAGVYAWQWGLAVRRFVAATNINDVVPQYLQTGIYETRSSVRTLSNAMDVGNPSNMERLIAVFERDWRRMSNMLHGEVVTDEETLEVMGELWSRSGVCIDPHTAVGYLGARRFQDKKLAPRAKIVILSTAHPAKFRETVKKATGQEPQLPSGLQEALRLPKQSTVVTNSLASLKEFLLTSFG
jgi:threonine synthase